MYEDDRAEEPPRAALAVDVEHAEDLEESDAADGGGGEDLPVRPHRQHHDRRRHHDQVCKSKRNVYYGESLLGRSQVW